MRPQGSLLLALVVGIALSAPEHGFAQAGTGTPPEVEGIEITDRSGEMVPLDIALRDESGAEVTLGDLMSGRRPVVIQLVYYSCPMLCTLVLNGYLSAAEELTWRPGIEYEVLSVSFDPKDTPELAEKKKANYVKALGGETTSEGWRFLTGEEKEVRRLAEALGFRYRWLESRKEFAHAAGMFVLTPEGKISRTLYGIEFPANDLKFSLLEASEGRLGTPLDKLVLYCFQYDPETHKYALVALNVMKLGGLLTMGFLGVLLTTLWVRERRQIPRPAV